ncbi:hypothetical protein Ae201684P_007344 [Aphanomyces euteiches]|uniref:Uncharacterized protein n=1 Tax=Aphanomyces euteiches TaxID=100861 RepID=A0A6G0WVD6_9STRA|nr:hypothetical protein Ae201684_011340 [Aphanomyces euteiches]KAH9101159.1 hypothetical protein Ae201684P_007344 [Aphanomyces euteiches]
MHQLWGLMPLMRLIFEFQTGYPQQLRPFVQYSRRNNLQVEMLLTQQMPLFLENMNTLDKILRPYMALTAPLTARHVDALLVSFPQLTRNVYCYAVWAGHLDLLRFMLPRVRNVYYSATEIAAHLGQLDVLVYLDGHKLATFSHLTLHWASRQGHLKVVEFLHPRIATDHAFAMDAAACHGHFDVVKFLHTNRTEGCTTKAMDSAAQHGHLEIVKFLHRHRSEGCTTAALDMAAANGHLELVKFLHWNRTEGATTTAMTLACCNGHLDVVKFLFEHRSEGCTIQALIGAREASHWDVVSFLLQHGKELHLDVPQPSFRHSSYALQTFLIF